MSVVWFQSRTVVTMPWNKFSATVVLVVVSFGCNTVVVVVVVVVGFIGNDSFDILSIFG